MAAAPIDDFGNEIKTGRTLRIMRCCCSFFFCSGPARFVLLLTAQTNTRNSGQHRNAARIANRSLVSSHGPLHFPFHWLLPHLRLSARRRTSPFVWNPNSQTICFPLSRHWRNGKRRLPTMRKIFERNVTAVSSWQPTEIYSSAGGCENTENLFV